MVERREFRGGLDYSPLSAEAVGHINACAKRTGFSIRITPTDLEIHTHNERDTSRRLVHFLSEIAPVVLDCDGEIECFNIDTADETKSFFEFFTIKSGQLYCQKGYIVRETVELAVV